MCNYVATVHKIQAVWNDYQAKCQNEESGGGNKRRSASAFNSNNQKRNQNGQSGQNKKPRFLQNFKPENRKYSKQEWGAMSHQQCREVIKFRRSKLAEKEDQASSTARKIASSIASETVSLSSQSAMDDRSNAASQFW